MPRQMFPFNSLHLKDLDRTDDDIHYAVRIHMSAPAVFQARKDVVLRYAGRMVCRCKWDLGKILLTKFVIRFRTRVGREIPLNCKMKLV